MERPDFRLGRWQDVLSDVECDTIICDPPYGGRTHVGHDSMSGRELSDGCARSVISYRSWTEDDVREFVSSWSQRTRGWIVALTSHDLWLAWDLAYRNVGRYPFAPIPCVTPGMSVRIAGDGPSSWSVYAMVARPRTPQFAKWGTLPGAYYQTRTSEWQHGGGGGRGKSKDLMKAIVRDYSRPGDVICDPTAGYGMTGVAALSMGRSFIGAECERLAYDEGVKRLNSPTNGDLFQ